MMSLIEWNTFGNFQFGNMGVACAEVACCLKHDVGAFVFGTVAADAYEYVYQLSAPVARLVADGRYGVGNEACLLGKVSFVAHQILVESGNDMVGIVGNELVEVLFGSACPLSPFFLCIGIVPQLSANVEIAVSQRHCPEYNPSVVAAQVVVEWPDVLGFQFEKHGVDELHDVVPLEVWQYPEKSCEVGNAAQFPRSALQIDVARIVFPEVAVRQHRALVAQLTQSCRQCGVDVAYSPSRRIFIALVGE